MGRGSAQLPKGQPRSGDIDRCMAAAGFLETRKTMARRCDTASAGLMRYSRAKRQRQGVWYGNLRNPDVADTANWPLTGIALMLAWRTISRGGDTQNKPERHDG